MNGSDYMKRALRLARRGKTSPNPMVGAVVIHEGRIVGEGFHPKAGEPHAEVFALRAAGELAKGADLYVILEPCCHQGRTPPCTDAVIQSGVKRVFAAMQDPNPEVGGKGFEILRRAGIEVQAGLMESEARGLNEAYIKRVTTGLPFVLWKAAMTLDGKIATRTGDSRWVTGEAARRYVHKLRAEADAVMVGIGTVLADDPQLTVRDGEMGRWGDGVKNPVRVVIDSQGRTPVDAKVVNGEAPTIIIMGRKACEEKLDQLWTAGVKVLCVQDVEGGVDLGYSMAELGKMGINRILLEGGGELAASMLAEGLVDKGLVFIAPKIVGGRDAKTPVEGKGVELMREALPTSEFKVRRFGNDIALAFDIIKNTEGTD
jgi:diaminohydroxyphosphoribosylaminopyrimidine deaminase/5-amino-6-(5-phosphoribosylamino)uracil reductase